MLDAVREKYRERARVGNRVVLHATPAMVDGRGGEKCIPGRLGE